MPTSYEQNEPQTGYVTSESMDRGTSTEEAEAAPGLRSNLRKCQRMTIRQTKRRCFLELVTGCDSWNEFYYFDSTKQRRIKTIAYSLEDSECCERCCCHPHHDYVSSSFLCDWLLSLCLTISHILAPLVSHF